MTDAERLALLNTTIDALPQILAEGGQKPAMDEYANRYRIRVRTKYPAMTQAELETWVEDEVCEKFPDATQAEINAVLKLELID